MRISPRLPWTLTVLAMPMLAPNASAFVVFSGDFQNGTGQIAITQDIVMEITQSANAAFLVFQDLVTLHPLTTSSVVNGGLLVSINNQPDFGILDSFYQNQMSLVLGDIAAGSGFVSFTPSVAMNAGDKITVRAATYTNLGNANFQAEYNSLGAWSGEVFLTNASGTTISAIVPEPSVVGLSILGGLFALRRRR